MKKKILLLFLSLFLLFLAGVIVTLYMIFQTTANLDTLVNLHKVEIIRQELVINVQTVQSNLYTTGTLFGKELDDMVDNVLDLWDGVQSCANCHHDSPVKEGIEELQELTDQYKEALSEFQSLIAKYPESPKTQGARLKVAYVYYELKNWSAAQESLQQIIKLYPGTRLAKKANTRLERITRNSGFPPARE